MSKNCHSWSFLTLNASRSAFSSATKASAAAAFPPPIISIHLSLLPTPVLHRARGDNGGARLLLVPRLCTVVAVPEAGLKTKHLPPCTRAIHATSVSTALLLAVCIDGAMLVGYLWTRSIACFEVPKIAALLDSGFARDTADGIRERVRISQDSYFLGSSTGPYSSSCDFLTGNFSRRVCLSVSLSSLV